MDPSVGPLAEIFRLDTDLLLNCVDGVSDEHGAARPLPGTNSMAFIVAHLVDARHFVLTLLGQATDNPLSTVLAKAKGIEEVGDLPPLSGLTASWREVARHLAKAIAGATAPQLSAACTQKFPVDDPSLLGGLAFLAQHESFHLGQLALLRKGLGYPAMKYTRSVHAPSAAHLRS
jgi:uncharacterized damage-inducible protein DinB